MSGMETAFEFLANETTGVDNETLFSNFTDFNENTYGNVTDSSQTISLNFLDSFVKSLSVMIVSELGDKTFFLAAILAMRYNKIVIFTASISSLILMTVISALLGYGVTSFIPPIYTYYASIVILFVFGLKMFWDAYKMKPDEAKRLHEEVENQIDGQEKKKPDKDDAEGLNCSTNLNGGEVGTRPDLVQSTKLDRLLIMLQFWKKKKEKSSVEDPEQTVPLNSQPIVIISEINSEEQESVKNGNRSTEVVKIENGVQIPTNLTEQPTHFEIKENGSAKIMPKKVDENGVEGHKTMFNGCSDALLENGNCKVNEETEMAPKKGAKIFARAKFWKKHESIPVEEIHPDQCDQIETEIVEPQKTGGKFFDILKVFFNTFGLIFLAEWGDRSQLATIVMASVNDVGGIILGSITGHTVCSLLAVIVGVLVAKKISVRVITIIGGCVFVGFAVASLIMGFEDPNTAELGTE